MWCHTCTIMFAITRRTLIAGACTSIATRLMYPRPALADAANNNDIHLRINELNRRDSKALRDKYCSEIIQWEAANADPGFVDACKQGRFSDEVLFGLSWMSAFYSKPLSIEKKVAARSRLLILYDKCHDPEQRQYIMSIMKYFELLD